MNRIQFDEIMNHAVRLGGWKKSYNTMQLDLIFETLSHIDRDFFQKLMIDISQSKKSAPPPSTISNETLKRFKKLQNKVEMPNTERHQRCSGTGLILLKQKFADRKEVVCGCPCDTRSGAYWELPRWKKSYELNYDEINIGERLIPGKNGPQEYVTNWLKILCQSSVNYWRDAQ